MPFSSKWVFKYPIKSYSWIFIPTESTIKNGKIIKSIIEKNWVAPNYFYHLKKGGHVKALKIHKENSFFIHLDIQDFFGHINKSRVTRCLKSFLGYERARKIAKESTVNIFKKTSKKTISILPFGFVQSPIIASLCFHKSKLGKYLHNINGKHGVYVSVYMDDIIVSSPNKLNLEKIFYNIEVLSVYSKFPLNIEKKDEPSNQITAFNIHLSHNLLEITDIKLNEFKNKVKDSQNIYEINGIISYISSINKEQAKFFVNNI